MREDKTGMQTLRDFSIFPVRNWFIRGSFGCTDTISYFQGEFLRQRIMSAWERQRIPHHRIEGTSRKGGKKFETRCRKLRV